MQFADARTDRPCGVDKAGGRTGIDFECGPDRLGPRGVSFSFTAGQHEGGKFARLQAVAVKPATGHPAGDVRNSGRIGLCERHRHVQRGGSGRVEHAEDREH